MIRLGFGKKKYPEIFFLKQIIKQGYNCIDIGANLGYYSFFISKYCGEKGKIIAVEPINLFVEIWKKNMKKSQYNNYELLQFALGESHGYVNMSTPLINGVLHHGMTRISETKEDNSAMMNQVEMRNPDELFKDMGNVDFIKIDIEGYEGVVLTNMQKLIKKHKPIIQAELSVEQNRLEVIKLLGTLDYKAYRLQSGKLLSFKDNELIEWRGDFYFFVDNYSKSNNERA